MFGLLNVRKPAGMTSRDVVNHVQRMVRPVKVGHAGTLDPLATGVLIVCVGQATRVVEYLQEQSKEYDGTFLLGRTSDTEDVEGNVTELQDARRPTEAEIKGVLERFRGRVMQRPPAFSAVKVAGRRAYQLARRGEEVSLTARPIDVHGLELTGYQYPEMRLHVVCGSGTYLRSLGRDIGEALGTGAVMSALTRTAVGGFRLDDACALGQLTGESIRSHLLSPLGAVSHMARVTLSDAEVTDIVHGKPIHTPLASGAGKVAAVDSHDRLVAVLVPGGPNQLRPARCFHQTAIES
ncbi:MAG: tRNA pseudouridine(55) synthase TruB [Planctomycetes bacterium]|nr:tRNA pseudouridine(55) synthase TruB [Planctomycetota bacterium]